MKVERPPERFFGGLLYPGSLLLGRPARYSILATRFFPPLFASVPLSILAPLPVILPTMSEADSPYLRCSHCRGFYESTLSHCKWCEYEAPLLAEDKTPLLFATRLDCRAIQIAEYHALPPEAHADSMKPPADHLTLVCECIHCGNDGHRFEAVEMRWIENEQMWACPCTTCGGRGFTIDIHPTDLGWHCCTCDHYFAPPDGKYIQKNAQCPQCGGTQIDGWWDDDDSEDLGSLFDEDEESNLADDSLPWDDDDIPFGGPDDHEPDDPYGLQAGMPWKESDSGEVPGQFDPEDDSGWNPAEPYDPRQPDDIDFPRPKKRERSDEDFNDDDIPF